MRFVTTFCTALHLCYCPCLNTFLSQREFGRACFSDTSQNLFHMSYKKKKHRAIGTSHNVKITVYGNVTPYSLVYIYVYFI